MNARGVRARSTRMREVITLMSEGPRIRRAPKCVRGGTWPLTTRVLTWRIGT